MADILLVSTVGVFVAFLIGLSVLCWMIGRVQQSFMTCNTPLKSWKFITAIALFILFVVSFLSFTLT